MGRVARGHGLRAALGRIVRSGVLGAGIALGAGCEATTPPRAYGWLEHWFPATRIVRISVGPIEQSLSDDRTQVYVSGSVRNDGDRTTRSLIVRVIARDAANRVVGQMEDLPSPQQVAPGTDVRYVVQFPNDPTISSFHVEAVGR